MSALLQDLKDTTATRWRNKLIGDRKPASNRRGEKQHWLTKVIYYRAMIRFLDRAGPVTPSWHDVIAECDPPGNRSTFYEVTGRNAKHSLIATYQAGERPGEAELAALYYDRSAADRLIDEAKVWSYWRYREGWLAELERIPDLTREMAADSLLLVVSDWAARNRSVAAALKASPPMCAVEDLLIIRERSPDVADIVRGVSHAQQTGRGLVGTFVAGALPEARASLLASALTPGADLVSRVAEVAYALIRELPLLSPQEANRTRSEALQLLRDTIDTLNTIPEGEE